MNRGLKFFVFCIDTSNIILISIKICLTAFHVQIRNISIHIVNGKGRPTSEKGDQLVPLSDYVPVTRMRKKFKLLKFLYHFSSNITSLVYKYQEKHSDSQL